MRIVGPIRTQSASSSGVSLDGHDLGPRDEQDQAWGACEKCGHQNIGRRAARRARAVRTLNGMTKGRVVMVTITGLVPRTWLFLCDSPLFPSKEEFGDY